MVFTRLHRDLGSVYLLLKIFSLCDLVITAPRGLPNIRATPLVSQGVQGSRMQGFDIRSYYYELGKYDP